MLKTLNRVGNEGKGVGNGKNNVWVTDTKHLCRNFRTRIFDQINCLDAFA